MRESKSYAIELIKTHAFIMFESIACDCFPPIDTFDIRFDFFARRHHSILHIYNER